ncbi:MAG TPA: lysine--tRNA ligase [Phycisphaerales bacterium]|nr:lysine--tRNA ligase [Phycisphaerales bacterium]
MHWTDEVADTLANYPMPPAGTFGGGDTHVINDSKTPSGRAHVGALRGVLIHDAMFRTLRARGVSVKYRFGCDDYDPVDELPHGMKEQYEKYLGQPLCNTPAPPGSKATDMADHFITDFWSVFKDLGVECEFYRMRDVYRAGQFNEAIDRILSQAAKVREIYKEVSNSDRPPGWLPFQVICENCGRIGTVECTNYDAKGPTVEYVCKPDLVAWAKGCGFRGKMSPMDGRGKLPWKLEWVAKWATFPVTIEGAGEDHNTKGGSRDVAAHCLRAIYGREAPQNIPYSFVLVGGKKMSSSKGLGVSAREVADFLPPEILRYLMLRTRPLSQTNFEPTEEALVKLFNEYDRAHAKTFPPAGVAPDAKFPVHERKNFTLSVVHERDAAEMGPYFECEFQLVLALVQMPHLDVRAEFERIKGSALTELERHHLERRIHAAREFIADYAEPEERLTLQTTPPAGTSTLSAVQRGFLRVLAERLKTARWEGDALQAAVFDAARETPIEQKDAFQAFYRVLLDNVKGPKAGNFLAFLKREDVVRLFSAVEVDEAEWMTASASSVEEIGRFAIAGKVRAMHAVVTERAAGSARFLEARLTMEDGKQHVRRVAIAPGEDVSAKERALRKVLPVQIA